MKISISDIISSLAKIDRIDLLKTVFQSPEIQIPVGVYEELERANELGYDFPKKVFKATETISMRDVELKAYKQKMSEERDLDKGEHQGIVIAKNRDMKFLTNDKVARKEAKKEKIKTYNLAEIIRAAYLDDELNKGEVEGLVKDLKQKDHFSFANEKDLYKD
ncbi:MAG: hypothetical protein KGY68_07935 [Candidatus Thermoplasmatota archaeon]|nr:hypothetical protein [Candidatus Thermoplasmatota archaeon]